MAVRCKTEQNRNSALLVALLILLLLPSASIAQPFPDWRQAIVDWAAAGLDTAFYKAKDSSTLSWGETYILQTFNLMHEADGDTLWLHKLAMHGYSIMNSAKDVPDDSLPYDPHIKDGYLGWGTARYSDDNMYEEYLVHDGHLGTELAKFIHTVYKDESLYEKFGERADSLLHFLERNVVGKWYSVWDSTLVVAEGAVDGAYPKWVGSANLAHVPVNQYAAFGHFLLELIQISRTEHYLPVNEDYVPWYGRVVNDMILEFKSMLHYDSLIDAYVWDYAKYCCTNDISHAAIETAFAFDCYRYGIGFSYVDMTRFAHTLTRHLWKNPPEIWNAELWDSFGQSEWSSYNLDYASRKWGQFGLIDPLACGIESGVYKDYAFQGGFKHTVAAGVATLAFVNRKGQPLVSAVGVTITESIGDGDNFPDPGEELALNVNAANFSNRNIDSLVVYASSDDDRIEIIQDEAIFSTIISNDSVSSSTPLLLRVRPDVEEGGLVKIALLFKQGEKSRRDSVEIAVGPTLFLLVDDDGGASYEHYYTDGVLDSLACVQYWDVQRKGAPGDFLQDYDTVIWFTGDEQDSTLTPDDREAIRNYLDNGGKLVLFSTGVENDMLVNAPADTAFFTNYLHALPSDKYTSALYTTLTTIVPEIYPTKLLVASSTSEEAAFRAIEPATDAVGLLQYLFGVGGILTTERHRVAYITFGLENMQQGKTLAEKLTRRRHFLGQLLSLVELPSGLRARESAVPEKFELSAFPNPFNGQAVVTFELNRPSDVQVAVYDVRGRRIKSLFAGPKEKGRHKILWDARNQAGHEIGSGVYILYIRTPEASRSLKICHIK